jgi:hypothetical protein
VGDAETAARHYREAALGLAQRAPEEPLSHVRPRTIRREATW